MHPNKLEAARHLAETHSNLDSDVQQVYLLEGNSGENDPDEPIKLLEVVEGTLETGIDPVLFAPNPGRGVPYRTVIVEISPREFQSMDGKNVRFGNNVWQVTSELFCRTVTSKRTDV